MKDSAGLLALVAFGALFVLLAIAFLRRAGRRRREMFEEAPPPPVRGGEAAPGEEPTTAELEARPADLVDILPPEDEGPPDVEAVRAEVPLEEPVRGEREEEEADEAPAAPAREADEALARGMQRTHDNFMGRIGRLFGSGTKIDPKVLDELEEALLLADVGVRLSTRLLDGVRAEIDRGELREGPQLREALKTRMLESVGTNGADPLAVGAKPKPHVILFVGVNGVGKTTTIGKVAQKFRDAGRSVVLAAGDTFRAAAVEQLTVWGERTGSRVVRAEPGSDPASVIFNAVTSAAKQGDDVVLADSAGRLHTKTNLMDEIRKVKRAAGKARDGAPDEVWLVVDATTGQNALRQAEEFHQALGLTGIILTKLDGTAKGGVVVAISDALHLPVLFVGVGEQAHDLRPFEGRTFVEAMFAG